MIDIQTDGLNVTTVPSQPFQSTQQLYSFFVIGILLLKKHKQPANMLLAKSYKYRFEELNRPLLCWRHMLTLRGFLLAYRNVNEVPSEGSAAEFPFTWREIIYLIHLHVEFMHR